MIRMTTDGITIETETVQEAVELLDRLTARDDLLQEVNERANLLFTGGRLETPAKGVKLKHYDIRSAFPTKYGAGSEAAAIMKTVRKIHKNAKYGKFVKELRLRSPTTKRVFALMKKHAGERTNSVAVGKALKISSAKARVSMRTLWKSGAIIKHSRGQYAYVEHRQEAQKAGNA